VPLDAELAALYGVTTARLNRQVRRNRERFPADFLFELTAREFANFKVHFATSSWGGRRKLAIRALMNPPATQAPQHRLHRRSRREVAATGSAWTRLGGCAATRRRRSG